MHQVAHHNGAGAQEPGRVIGERDWQAVKVHRDRKKMGDDGNPSPPSPGNALLLHCRQRFFLNTPFCMTSLSSHRQSMPAGFPVALATSLRRTGCQLMCREGNTSTAASANSSKPSLSLFYSRQYASSCLLTDLPDASCETGRTRACTLQTMLAPWLDTAYCPHGLNFRLASVNSFRGRPNAAPKRSGSCRPRAYRGQQPCRVAEPMCA